MKLHKAASITILVILNILYLLPKVFCSGVIELQLTSFTNSRGLDYDGSCCNGVLDTSNPALGPMCSETCHTFFTICLTNYMNTIPPDLSKDKCLFGYVMTDVLGSNNVNFESLEGFNNVINFHFNFSWPGTFSIILEAWHDATLSNPVTGSPRERISRLAVQRELQVGSEWSNFIHKTDKTELEYRYRVRCDTNYYDAGCSKLCRPRDDHFGHYTCDENGDIVCMKGWLGQFCDQAICAEGCHPDHGFCDQPNECKCRGGWEGSECTECIKYPGCKHGTCSRPWECNCDEGWGGLYCTLDLQFCTRHNPCLNGGVCQNTGSGSYTCICQEGYNGTNCEREVDDCLSKPCVNGDGRCIDELNGYKCVCEQGFTGSLCEENIDDCSSNNPCLNGATCIDKINGHACRCVAGFVGELCDTNVDDCETRPCANGGLCEDLVNDFNCTCRPGYAGKFCTIVINPCESSPCRNGATCRPSINNYHCECVPGFTGKNCQYLPGQIVTSTTRDFSSEQVRTTTPSNKQGNTAMHQEDQDEEFTTTQLLLIVCLGVGIPLLAIIIVVTILLCRRRRRPDTRKEEDENIQNSINNKLRESKIFTTLPQSSSNISNLASKVSNQDSDYNSLKSFKRPSSQIYVGDKYINKQLIKPYNTDLQVHSKTSDYEKPAKSYEKEKVSIDPSNLDISHNFIKSHTVTVATMATTFSRRKSSDVIDSLDNL
ncbi:DLLD-like protein [Mya arenaria]|uniref:DLLD-like protein n=1 Tax=Mya arenaria TaxID=6604 RepID=A0ABY7FEE9_MYAAR|nr:DLLD-like protein [Mya arenaria]